MSSSSTIATDNNVLGASPKDFRPQAFAQYNPSRISSDWNAMLFGTAKTHGTAREASTNSQADLTEFRRSLKHLRVKLLEMMRTTLRVVDYTAKACGSYRAEIALHAAGERNKLGCLPISIRAICHRLHNENELNDEALEILGAMRAISVALVFACKYARDVSSHIASLVGEGRYMQSQVRTSLSDCVNRSLRLCIVAFVNREISHAESALRKLNGCQFIFSLREGTRIVTQTEMGRSLREQPIEKGLMQMMDSVRIVALQLTCPAPYSI